MAPADRAAAVVRPARPADHEAWSELWRGYNAFYGREGDTALPPDVVAATWVRLLDDDHPIHALVAEVDGAVAGLVHLVYHASTIQLAPTCYLADLFTAEAARGRGVGRLLIDAACRHAAERGVPRIYWHTQQGNATARRLYDTLAEWAGFIVYRKDC